MNRMSNLISLKEIFIYEEIILEERAHTGRLLVCFLIQLFISARSSAFLINILHGTSPRLGSLPSLIS